MNAQLRKVTEEWMQLERKTLKQRQVAEEFYEQNLMTLIEKDYIKRNRSKLIEEVECLILSVGTSYEPLVLNIMLLRPKKILFLYTDQSETIIEKIVRHCGLTASRYNKERVEETNPLSIYRQIKESYIKWQRPEKIYIDFTGGTKAMSAAAALAGALIEVQLVYVGTTHYLQDMRKPEPGSEILVFIDNPLAIFGDLEIEKAMVLFDEYNYTGAREKLEYLMNTVPEPNIRQQLEFAANLASAYEAWDSLNFPEAEEQMRKLILRMKRDHPVHRSFLMMDYLEHFDHQLNILQKLNQIAGRMREEEYRQMLSDKEVIAGLIFSLYQNAMVRERQEKYDMAALLFYRQLEMVEQRRLMGYNLYASHMVYQEMKDGNGNKATDASIEILKNKLTELKRSVFGRPVNSYLPDQISLLEGYLLLLALNDEISFDENGRHIDFIKKIRSMVYLRNNSIYAHGLGPVGKRDYERFRDFTIEVLVKFCRLEGIDMEGYIEDVEWLNPKNSLYYTGLGN